VKNLSLTVVASLVSKYHLIASIYFYFQIMRGKNPLFSAVFGFEGIND